MDSGRCNFLYEDGFDTIIAVIDGEMLQNKKELNLEINLCIKMPLKNKQTNKKYVPCAICARVCLLSGDLRKNVRKKAPIFQGTTNCISRWSWVRFSPNIRNETGITNSRRFLWEKYLQNRSRLMLLWCYLASRITSTVSPCFPEA